MAPLVPPERAEFYSMPNMHNESEPRFGRSVSIDQAAQLLHVSRRTIYNRIKEGKLQTMRTAGGSRRVLMESLYELGFKPQAFPTSAAATTFSIRPIAR